MTAYPGEEINIYVVTVGQLNGVAPKCTHGTAMILWNYTTQVLTNGSYDEPYVEMGICVKRGTAATPWHRLSCHGKSMFQYRGQD